jgi:hypothetical protein
MAPLVSGDLAPLVWPHPQETLSCLEGPLRPGHALTSRDYKRPGDRNCRDAPFPYGLLLSYG